MPEKKLNLFQFTSGRPTQTSARATQVMGCEAHHSRFCGEFLDNVPCKRLPHSERIVHDWDAEEGRWDLRVAGDPATIQLGRSSDVGARVAKHTAMLAGANFAGPSSG